MDENPYQSPTTLPSAPPAVRKRRSALIWLWLFVGLAAGAGLGFLLTGGFGLLP